MMFLKLRKKACHDVEEAATKIDIKIKLKIHNNCVANWIELQSKNKVGFWLKNQPSYLQYDNMLDVARDGAK